MAMSDIVVDKAIWYRVHAALTAAEENAQDLFDTVYCDVMTKRERAVSEMYNKELNELRELLNITKEKGVPF